MGMKLFKKLSPCRFNYNKFVFEMIAKDFLISGMCEEPMEKLMNFQYQVENGIVGNNRFRKRPVSFLLGHSRLYILHC